jgi:HEAT repeat protein
MQPLIQSCRDPDPQVRQAAVYGVGVCAQYGGALFAAQIGEALNVIHGIVNAPNARDEDNGFASDNAISALGKMILFQPEALGSNRAAAVGIFLAYLPVVTDEEVC